MFDFSFVRKPVSPFREGLARICGSRSTEHEVYACSARNVCDAVDKSKYDICLIRVEKSGSWTLLQSAAELKAKPGFKRFDTSLSAFQQSVVFARQTTLFDYQFGVFKHTCFCLAGVSEGRLAFLARTTRPGLFSPDLAGFVASSHK